jgi:glycosyltransferase involved in cell wall biosynthesis
MYVLTSSLAMRFLSGQLRFVQQAGYDVTVVSAPGEELARVCESEAVRAVAIPMQREISPLKDLISLWRLWRVMRRLRPSITNVGTPKAGLLGGLAAVLAGVPCRIYTLHGLRVETMSGIKRGILMFTEKLACWAAHRIIAVSESLRKKAISLGLAGPERIKVMHSGSCNGIDVTPLAAGERSRKRGCELRQKLGIPFTAPVVGFGGRFTRDKGIGELLDAFTLLHGRFPEVRLLLVGDFEPGDLPAAGVIHRIRTDDNIVSTGFVPDATSYYDVMDVLALPTYREGFPTVVLEAHAAGKPAVVTNATGAVDSVVDGATGFIVPVGDSTALADALAKLLGDPSLAATMGENGRQRAIAEFQPARIWSELVRQYQSLLAAKGLALPIAPLQAAGNAETAESGLVSSCAHSSSD